MKRRIQISLFDLPVDVMRFGVLTHLSLCEMAKLDMAVLNHSSLLRLFLHEIFDGMSLSFAQYREVMQYADDSSFTHLFFSEVSCLKRFNPHMVRWLVQRGFWVPALRVHYMHSEHVVALGPAFPELECLDLSSLSTVRNRAYDVFRYLPCLKFVSLPMCNVAVGLVEIATWCPRLRVLSTPDSLALHSITSQCKELEVLRIRGGSVGTVFSHCPSLIHLQFDFLFYPSYPRPTALDTKFPNLVSLSICRDHSFSNEFVTELVLPRLQWLNISDCDGVSDEAIATALRNCTNLCRLDIINCKKRDHSAFTILLTDSTTQLNRLQLSFSNVNVSAFGEKFRHLLYVDLSYRVAMCDSQVEHLSLNCPHLTHVNLDGCTSITENSVIAITKNCRLLFFLSLYCCPMLQSGISVANIVAKNCTKLKFFRYTLWIKSADDDKKMYSILRSSLPNVLVFLVTAKIAPPIDATSCIVP